MLLSSHHHLNHKTFQTTNHFMAKVIIHSILVFFTLSAEVPSPPEILDVECRSYSAILSWSPTGDAHISSYIIQYETNFSPGDWTDYEFRVPLRDPSVRLILSPWTNYTFRVIAKNEELVSLPSSPSKWCETMIDVPYKNPDEVYGRGNGPNNLVISWKPMPPIDHNAPGFYYKVSWKQDGITDDDDDESSSHKWHFRTIKGWEQHKLLIENLPKLKPFRIKVEAFNSQGQANVNAEELIGYSDEDKPSAAPKHFRLVEARDGRSAVVAWEAVEAKSLNGHFKGYKIQSWTVQNSTIKEVILLPNVTKALIDVLSPNTINFAKILAFNGAFDGPASNQIEIETEKDIFPDVPSLDFNKLPDNNKGEPVVSLLAKPNFSNGNPGQGYYFQYRPKGIDTLVDWTPTPIEEINVLKKNDIQAVEIPLQYHNTFYEFRVVAKSGNKETESVTVGLNTGGKSAPTTKSSPSSFSISSTTETEVEIFPNRDQNKTPDPIIFFPPDVKKFPNDPKDAGLIPSEEPSSFARAPWFITLLVVLFCVIIFFVAFLIVKRRKQKGSSSSGRKVTKYNVKDNKLKITDNVLTTKITENPMNVDVEARGATGGVDFRIPDETDRGTPNPGSNNSTNRSSSYGTAPSSYSTFTASPNQQQQRVTEDLDEENEDDDIDSDDEDDEYYPVHQASVIPQDNGKVYNETTQRIV